jgi:uncharacterized protein (UPF0332 family)
VNEAKGHILKARENIGFARYALAGEYTDEAGRGAYMAAFHAALAFVVARTGKSPKAHGGTRSEFARLARDEQRIGREQVSLLGWSYELKNVADYGQEHSVSIADAARAIDEASRLIETSRRLSAICRPENPAAQLIPVRAISRPASAATTTAHPDVSRLIPTSKPKAQMAVPGQPAMMMAANTRSAIPLISIQPQVPAIT